MVRTGNLKDVAYDSVLEMIRSHAFEADTVYSERQISAEIGVSRTPFHSALLQLEKEGYIDVLPSRGFMLHQLTRDDVLRTFEVRGAVELYCCSRVMEDLQGGAGVKAEAADGGPARARALVERLREECASQAEIARTTRDIEAYEGHDFAFHQAIVSYVGNPEFDRLFRSYMFWIEDLAERSLGHEGRMEDALDEHEAIIAALEAGKVDGLYAACKRHFTVPQALNLEDLEEG